MFVSQASAAEGGDVSSYGLRKQVEVVKNCRKVRKQDLKFNAATPVIKVDPETLVSCSVIQIYQRGSFH
jgi:urease